MNKSTEEVEIHIEARVKGRMACPDCGNESGIHDRRERRWRHLDTCEYRTLIVAQVPRVRCPEHGVNQVIVPWGEWTSRFTKAFEAFAIGWLNEATVSGVARRLRLSWDQVDGIMQRAVKRGLERREEHAPKRIRVDETSFQKRHEYVTVVTDLDTRDVLHVADDRTKESLSGFFELCEPGDLLDIEVVSMDMWPAYISTTNEWIPHAGSKICFDKFHIAQYLGNAVDKVRRPEQKQLVSEGNNALVRRKYKWLRNPESPLAESPGYFERMKRIAIRTARAWAIKEHAMCLWHYKSRTWARKAWRAWISCAMRSRLEPVKRVARMVRKHLEGIINAIVMKATNSASESINAKIQRVKRMACGFRNRERFRTAIYFHLGGLELLPSSHTRP